MDLIKTNNRQEWLAVRKTGIGGSDIATIMGLNPYSSPLQLYLEKTNPAFNKEANIAMEIGTELEPYLRRKAQKLISERDGFVIEILQMPDTLVGEKPHYLANIDGYYFCQNKTPIGLEAKTTTARAKSRWIEDIPDNYFLQVQWYLQVTGWAKFDLIILIDNNKIELKEIYPDREVIKEMRAQADAFQKLVETKTPPEPTAKDDNAMRFLYPQTTPGKIKEITPEEEIELEKLLKDLDEAKSKSKAAEETIKAVKNYIKAKMQDAELLTAAGHKMTYKTIKKEAYTVPASEYRMMRITEIK